METINDILEEMRSAPFNWSYPEGIPQTQRDNDKLSEYADRIEAVTKREMDSIKNDESYVVEIWDSFFNHWIVFTEFLDRADAEKEVSYRVEVNKRYRTKSKYRIVRKTIKQEIVYETGND